MPAIWGAVKQPDAVKGQDKCKIRFHSRLTIIRYHHTGILAGLERHLQQLLAEGKKNTPEQSSALLVACHGWCKLGQGAAWPGFET
jgi:alpha-D-ribose 1-methylphosphonate 5-triphosphate synthase subunit PhnH